jgi:hypothetical protein
MFFFRCCHVFERDDDMTAQEKWIMTIRYMEMVRANYHLLHECRPSAAEIRYARRMHGLRKWREAIDAAYRKLREKRGKSAARARHDWLVARMLELMVFDAASDQMIRHSITPGKTVHQRYADALKESAVRAVMLSAEGMGLLRRSDEA